MVEDVEEGMTPRFSERIGVSKVEIQVGSMNEALKNSIWNFIRSLFPEPNPSTAHVIHEVVRLITVRVLKRPVDEISTDWSGALRDWLREQYASLTWFEVYDLLEFVVENAERMSGGRLRTPAVVPAINGILDEENAGYSFVGGQL